MSNPDAVPRYTFGGMLVTSSHPLPELLPGAEDAADRIDIVFSDDSRGPFGSVEWFHTWHDHDSVWARFGIAAGQFIVEFPEQAVFVVSPDAQRVVVHAAPTYQTRHLLLHQVLPLVVGRRGRLVLHAGAVAFGSRCAAFLGPTGAGKSTLVAACVAAGASLISDDCLVLTRDDASWVAWPSYPAVRLWEESVSLLGARVDGLAQGAASDKRLLTPGHHWSVVQGPTTLSHLFVLEDPDLPAESAAGTLATQLFSQVFRLDIRDLREAAQVFTDVADMAATVAISRLPGPPERRDPAEVAARCREALRVADRTP
jgi:hypothetical protein